RTRPAPGCRCAAIASSWRLELGVGRDPFERADAVLEQPQPSLPPARPLGQRERDEREPGEEEEVRDVTFHVALLVRRCWSSFVVGAGRRGRARRVGSFARADRRGGLFARAWSGAGAAGPGAA